jgi:hypothetical protein
MRAKTPAGFDVKRALLSRDFNPIWTVVTDFTETRQYPTEYINAVREGTPEMV